MSYCAVLIRSDDDRAQIYTLRARALSQAKREARRYLAGFRQGMGRLELYRLLPGQRMPELVWMQEA